MADRGLGSAGSAYEAAGHRALGSRRQLLLLPDKADDAGLTDDEFHRLTEPDGVLFLRVGLAGLLRPADSRDRERAIEALQTTLRDAIERGTARFGRMGMRGSLLSGIPDGYDRDAVEIALPLIEAWLESNDHDPMGGRSWYALGWLCDSLERPEDARRAWSRSLADWEQLARETPGSGTLYNLACGYALLGQAEDALGALERAVDAGYMNTQHARYDRDFGSLNEDPRFEALLVRMDAIQRAYFEAQAEEDGPERASDAKP